MTELEVLMEGGGWRKRLERSARTGDIRKLCLVACACCRRVWRLLRSESSRRAVALAERRADGHLDRRLRSAYPEALRAAEKQGWPQHQAAASLAAAAADPDLPQFEQVRALLTALDRLMGLSDDFREPFQAVLADVLGPSVQGDFAPEWRTPTVLALACQVVEGRDETAMLVLADALEDAGCVDYDLLGHCRSGMAHVRGCWAVDAVLIHEPSNGGNR